MRKQAAFSGDSRKNLAVTLTHTLLGGAGALALAGFAAGTASAAEGGNLETIVVTAQRRAENLQAVPISVAAITASSLNKSGISSTIQLAQVVPSIQITRSGPQTIFFIRGVGNTAANIGEEGANSIYVDGVYLGDLTSVNTDFNNIERIEVLKGPQGTLFGRNSSGGLINIITREPGDKTVVKASVGYGNYDTFRGQLYAATPINDKLAVDVALTGRDQNKGWGKNLYNGDDYSLGWMYGARMKFVYRPGDATKVTLSGDYKRSKDSFTSGFQILNGSLAGSAAAGFYPYQGDYNVNGPNVGSATIRVWGAALTIEHQFDWATLTSLSGTRYVRVQSLLDADYTPATLTFADVQGKTRTFQQELRLSSPGTGKLTWQFGGFYYHANSQLLSQTVTGNNVGGPGRGLQIVATGKTDSYAAFGEVTYAVTPTTHVTGGVRYTSDHRDYVGLQRAYNQVPGSVLIAALTVPQKASSATFNKATFRAAVRQELSDDINVYASFNRGFKSGIFALNANPNTAPIIRPQTIDAFEVGLKSELLNRTVRANLSYFHYNVKDYQIRTAAPGNTATALLLNAGTVKVDGAEAELQWAPTPELLFNANLTYLNSRFGDFPLNSFYVPKTTGNVATPCVLSSAPRTGANTTCVGPATGNRTPLSPRFSASIGVSYTADLGNDQELIAAGLFSYTGKAYFEADNRLNQPGFSVFNGTLEYRPNQNWGIELWANNIGDKRYYAVEAGGTTGDHGELAPPRTFGVNVKFDM